MIQQKPLVKEPNDSGAILSWPWGPTSFERRIGNGATRILVALVGIPIVLLIFYKGGWWFAGFALAIALGGMVEIISMLRQRGFYPFVWIVVTINLLILFIICAL